MPDLLDELRRYGEAVEVAASERTATAYPTEPVDPASRLSGRRLLIGAVAASLVLVLVVAGTLVASRQDRGIDRIETPPPTSVPPTPADPPQRFPATELAPSSAIWADHDPGPLAVRDRPAAVWTGERLLIWGGTNLYRVGENARSYDDGASFDPATGAWTLIPPSALAARNDAVAAWTGSEMLIWGGNSAAETEEPGALAYVDGAAFDPTRNSWRVLPPSPLPPGPRYVGAWTGEVLVVVGAADGVVHAAEYDPARSWTLLDTAGIDDAVTMQQPVVHWTGSRIVVVDQLPLGDPVMVFTLDPTSGEWTSSASPSFASRAFGSAVFDGRLFLVGYGGLDGTSRYDPVGDRWGDTVLLDDLGCEATPTVVGTSDALYVRDWCGHAGMFEPASETWTSLPEPGPRFDGTPPIVSAVVWTGTELLAWGGYRYAPGDGGDGGMAVGTWTLRP
jgi:hypothetical protein